MNYAKKNTNDTYKKIIIKNTNDVFTNSKTFTNQQEPIDILQLKLSNVNKGETIHHTIPTNSS